MSWNCKNDKPDGVEIPAPPQNVRVAEATKHFAEGDFQAILAKGGPDEGFLWAHLHGIHNDRAGETKYTVSVFVLDDSNYNYFLPVALETTVEGVLDKPERHRHCFAQFTPEGVYVDRLKKAFDKGIKLRIDISGDRDRNDIAWATEEIKNALRKYYAGEISSIQALDILNQGKKPAYEMVTQ